LSGIPQVEPFEIFSLFHRGSCSFSPIFDAKLKKFSKMISDSEKNIILRYARKYNVETVILFGSSINEETDYKDIDIAVKGVKPGFFFKFYGELFRELPKPVDLVDLSDDTLFNRLIIKKGLKIYG